MNESIVIPPSLVTLTLRFPEGDMQITDPMRAFVVVETVWSKDESDWGRVIGTLRANMPAEIFKGSRTDNKSFTWHDLTDSEVVAVALTLIKWIDNVGKDCGPTATATPTPESSCDPAATKGS